MRSKYIVNHTLLYQSLEALNFKVIIASRKILYRITTKTEGIDATYKHCNEEDA